MERKELIRRHESLRAYLKFFVWPVIGMVLINWALKRYVWETMTWVHMVIVCAILLLLPLWAWIRSISHTYIVYSNGVFRRDGILSKETSEIRIQDIREINVRQSPIQRVLRIGRIGFSSAAAGGAVEEEVVFDNVKDPEAIKALVQRQMPHSPDTDDGE